MSRIAILALLAIPFFAWPDTLLLKSGKEYTGVFVGGTETRVRFNVGHGVIRSFPIREVDRIQFGAQAETPRAASGSQPTMRASEAGPAPQSSESAARSAPAALPPTVAAPEPPPLTIPEVGTGSSAPLADMGAIDSEYTARGSDAGVLGQPRAPTQPTQDKRAVVRFYQNGAIYWTSSGGAHSIYGPILDAWMAAGGEHSRLGYPTRDRQEGNAGYNLQQTFQHGVISWNPKDGAQIQYSGGAQ